MVSTEPILKLFLTDVFLDVVLMIDDNTLVMVTLVAFVVAFAGLIATPSVVNRVMADPNKGNNGQCRQLQDTFPPDLQDYAGCHDTFTGSGHNEPPPLP
jgi:hypothetical protein